MSTAVMNMVSARPAPCRWWSDGDGVDVMPLQRHLFQIIPCADSCPIVVADGGFFTLLYLFHVLSGTLIEELGFPEILVPAELFYLLIFRLSWTLVTNFYGTCATALYLQLQLPDGPV